MTTISKTARKSATALLLGAIALTCVTAQAMDKIEDHLQAVEQTSKNVEILDKCLQAEKAKGTRGEEANTGIQYCAAMAVIHKSDRPIEMPLFTPIEMSRVGFRIQAWRGQLSIDMLKKAQESGEYNNQSIDAAIKTYQDVIRVSKGMLDILENPENKQ